MHEGLDQHHLALVSGRVLAELAAGVELKALDQPLEVRVIDATPQVCEILEDLSARQIGIEGRLTGHIADETLDLQRLLPAIEPGDSRRAGVGVQQGHQQTDGRRLPRTVRSQEAEDIALLDLERNLGNAALAAVALGEFFDIEHSLIDALLDHGGEKRDHAAHGQPAELFTDDRVAVRVPDLDDGEDQVFLFRLAAGDALKERLQLAQGRHVRVIQERRQVRDGHVGETLDDRLEQRLLRIEVVVKGALGGFELVQDVLDAHRLVPFRLDEALGHVQKRVATDHMTRRIHGPGHACTISDRRSVYLWLSVRQGAPKQYAVRPVGAGGAERQQVPGVAG